MGDRRRYQERAIILNSGDLVLEGLWNKGADGPALVIGAPHPSFGGSMDSPVVAEAAYGAVYAGCPVLRFNYRGVGASQGESEAGQGEVDDYRAAIEHLCATHEREDVIAAGYSFGAWVAVQAAVQHDRVSALLLISPANRDLDFTALKETTRLPVLVVHGGADKTVDVDALDFALAERARVDRVVVEAANHIYDQGLGELSRNIQAWLNKIRD